MADIQFNVDAALAKLGELVAKHGPDAVDMAAQVMRINAVNTLSGVVGWSIAAWAAATSVKWLYRRAKEADFDDGIGFWIGATIASLVTGGFAFAALVNLFDVWAWVALFNPKLALAHAVLAKFAGL